jgi:hypothetical protein
VSAIGFRSYTDVRLRDRIYATATLGVTLPGEHSEARRISGSPNQGWLEGFRRDGVRVAPGAIIELGLAPRAQLTDYLVVGAEWRYRQKGEDALTLANTGPVPSYGEFFTLNVDQMESESAWSEHRLAWSIAFSTLPSVRAGSARRPIEIGYTHEQVVSSARGIVPERFTDRIQLRYYARFLGR